MCFDLKQIYKIKIDSNIIYSFIDTRIDMHKSLESINFYQKKFCR